jgi:integrase
MSLSLRDADEYRAMRSGETVRRTRRNPSVAQINRELQLLRRLCMWAVTRKMIPVNPLEGIRFPDENNIRTVVLGEAQAANLFAACWCVVLRSLLVVLWDTGMRRDEARLLRMEQVDWERRVITLQRSDTKTREARMIPMTARAAAHIRGLVRYHASPYVFVRPTTGRPYSANVLEVHWRRVRAEAGLHRVWLHDLRRSWVTLARRRGVAESVVKRWSGHKTDSVFRRYSITEDADLFAARDTIEAGIARETASLDRRGPARRGLFGRKAVRKMGAK